MDNRKSFDWWQGGSRGCNRGAWDLQSGRRAEKSVPSK